MDDELIFFINFCHFYSPKSLIGFYSTAAGQSPDLVFGLYLCRGDVSAKFCRDYVVFAVNDILSRCPDQKESMIWYDECLPRYSDQNIFLESSHQYGTTGTILYNTENVRSNQVDQYKELLLSTMNQSITEAVNSTRKFHDRKANFTGFQNLYILVQCVLDMPRELLKGRRHKGEGTNNTPEEKFLLGWELLSTS